MKGKKIECDRCGAKFPLKQNLNRHIEAVHEGKKPFKCDKCDVCFTQKSSMRTHISKIHAKKKM